MGRVGKRPKRAGKVGHDRHTIRLTRIRSAIDGAPALMTGLDEKNRATESLPPDPEPISALAVRRRLPRSHKLARPTVIKIVGRLAQSLSSASAKPKVDSEAEAKPAGEKQTRQNKASTPSSSQQVPQKRIVIKWIKSGTAPRTTTPKRQRIQEPVADSVLFAPYFWSRPVVGLPIRQAKSRARACNEVNGDCFV